MVSILKFCFTVTMGVRCDNGNRPNKRQKQIESLVTFLFLLITNEMTAHYTSVKWLRHREGDEMRREKKK